MALTFTAKAGTSGSPANWSSSSTWTVTGSGGTSTYPGQSENTDIVVIGNYYVTLDSSVPASITIASISFGSGCLQVGGGAE
jgi:hypothetical protein